MLQNPATSNKFKLVSAEPVEFSYIEAKFPPPGKRGIVSV